VSQQKAKPQTCVLFICLLLNVLIYETVKWGKPATGSKLKAVLLSFSLVCISFHSFWLIHTRIANDSLCYSQMIHGKRCVKS